MLAKERIVEMAAAICAGEPSEALRVKAVHDWIIRQTAYDYDNFKRGSIPSTSYRATGVIENGMAVCAGYARATVQLLSAAGVETREVAGRVQPDGGRHAWNMVRVDGVWYHLDVTWDDPVPDVPGRVDYAFFLVSTSTIGETHSVDRSLPTAPVDYLSGIDTWDGRPIVHLLDDIPATVTELLAMPRANRSFTVWRLDSDAALTKAREGVEAAGKAGRSIARVTWSGHRHTGRVFLLEKGESIHADSVIRRPWFRLRSADRNESMTVAARGGETEVALDRGAAKALFPSVRDGEGRSFHKYFPVDGTPLLRFRFRGDDRGWVVCGPTRACMAERNRFVSSGRHLGATEHSVLVGARYQLESWRRGGPVDALVLSVEG